MESIPEAEPIAAADWQGGTIASYAEAARQHAASSSSSSSQMPIPPSQVSGLPSETSSLPLTPPPDPKAPPSPQEQKTYHNIKGRFLKRGGMDMWRVMSVHLHNEHVNRRREHGRKTVADIIGLALRDQVDIVSGDWNQAGWYLEESTSWEVKLYEQSRGLAPGTVQWAIPGPTYEIRTIFFNWSKDGMVYDMFVKDMSKFRHLVNEDFGLRAQDGDAHLPQFLGP